MWDIIPSIKTAYTLAAFVAPLVVTVLWRLIDRKRRLIVSAPESEHYKLVRDALEFFHVDTIRLTREQQFDLAMQQIRLRARRFLAVTFVTILALLACAFVAIKNSDAQKSQDSARVRSEIAAALSQAGTRYTQLISELRETRAQLIVVVNRLSNLPIGDPDRTALSSVIERSRNQIAQIANEARDMSAVQEQLMAQRNLESEFRDRAQALHSQSGELDRELAETNSQLNQTDQIIAGTPQGIPGSPLSPTLQNDSLPQEAESSIKRRAAPETVQPEQTPTREPVRVPDPPTNLSVQ